MIKFFSLRSVSMSAVLEMPEETYGGQLYDFNMLMLNASGLTNVLLISSAVNGHLGVLP